MWSVIKDRRIEKARSLSGRPAEDTGGCREAGWSGQQRAVLQIEEGKILELAEA